VWQSASAIAVAGDRVLVSYQGGMGAMPRTGGKLQPLLGQPVSALGGDAHGWAASEGNALLASDGDGEHIVAMSKVGREVGSIGSLAVGGGFVYHIDYVDAQGVYELRGDPIGSGAQVWPLASGHSLDGLAVDGASGTVYASYLDSRGEHLATLSSHGDATIADLPQYATGLAADHGDVVIYAEGNLYRIDRGRAVARSADESYVPLALHKGIAYSGSVGTVYAVPITGKKLPFVVADSSRFGEEPSVAVVSIAFTEDYLYYVLPNGLARVDEHGHDEMVYTAADGTGGGDDTAPASLVAIVDESAYVVDGTSVIAVPLEGGAGAPIYTTKGGVIGIWSAGPRLIAQISDDNGEAFLQLAPGQPREIWRSSLDAGHVQYVATSEDTLYLGSAELGGVLAVPLQKDQPSASP
jgi:hypothetical protein